MTGTTGINQATTVKPIKHLFYNLIDVRSKASQFIFLLVAVYMYSCSSPMNVHNPSYQHIFDKLDSLPLEDDIRMLDSIKTVFETGDPGADEWAQYFRMRANIAKSVDPYRTNLVLDSLETFLIHHKYLPDFKRYYVEMLTARVEAHTLTRQFDEGLKVLTDAQQYLDEDIGDSCLILKVKHALADLLMKTGRYQLAASYFIGLYNDASACDSTSFDRFYESYSGLSNAAYSYQECRMYDSANYYYQHAINLINDYYTILPEKTAYFHICRGIVSGNWALTKVAQKQFAEAEKLFQAAILITVDEYPNFSRNRKLDLADLYIETDLMAKAKVVIDELDEQISHSHTLDYANYELSLVKKRYYQKLGNLKMAMSFNDLANALNDSLEIINRTNVERDYAMEFAATEQRNLNNLLKRQNERTTFHLQLALIGVLTTLLIIGLIWSNLLRTSRYSQVMKRLNEEIRKKNRDILDAYHSLEKSYNTNRELMRTVAHDLKSPINAIRIMMRWFSNKLSDPEDQKNVKVIEDTCGNAIRLIDNMIQSDSQKFSVTTKSNQDLLRLLEYCVEMMRPRAEEKGQKLRLEGVSAEAYVDKDKMWRVIVNIIANAIKFSPEKSEIVVKLEKSKREVILSVKDNGIGIPRFMMQEIFEATPGIQRNGTVGEESSGLGLNIVKKIVEEHNGKLWVESEEGRGSAFFVTIPVVTVLAVSVTGKLAPLDSQSFEK